MTEKQLENKFKSMIGNLPWTFFYKIHGSGAQSAGIPDIIACVRGEFVAFELKAKNGKLSELQKFKLREIHKNRGCAFVVTPDNYNEIYEYLKRKTERKDSNLYNKSNNVLIKFNVFNEGIENV